MKPLMTCLLSAVLITSNLAFAGGNAVYYDYGRVIKVKPVFHKTHHSHSLECSPHHNGHHGNYKGRKHNSKAPTFAGAVVGGVIGNTLGKNSSHRGLVTVAGAVVGGVVGHEIGENVNDHHVHKRHHDSRCVVTHEYGHGHNNGYKGKHKGKRLKGYQVTYRYKGEKFTTFTPKHPGERIRLEVSVRPAVYKYK